MGQNGPASAGGDKREALQHERERQQRDAALGRRAREIASGQYGPVLRRWINGSVTRVAQRIREVAQAQLAGDAEKAANLLSSPTFGLASVYGREGSLNPILSWCLKGRSPGRGAQTTFADDLALTALAEVLRLAARFTYDPEDGAKGVTLSTALNGTADCLRECVVGQFLTAFQGADAVQALKPRGHGNAFRKSKKLSTIANVLLAQVRPQLESAARGEIELEAFGSRQILKVIDGEHERRVSIIPPTAEDWRLLAMARKLKAHDPHATAWQTFALMVVCCAEIECGWFEQHTQRRGKKTPRYLALSKEAHEALVKDMDHWLHAGMMDEPMLVPPLDGGYLTVKHRPVTARKSIRGLETRAENTDAWDTACEVLGGTAWTVPERTLSALDARPDLVERSEPDELKRALVLASYKRLAKDEFYLPLYMDFRGRCYTRSPAVTYQGSDLQKALMCFPANTYSGDMWGDVPNYHARALHLSALAGLDKQTLSTRLEWTRGLGGVMGDVQRGRWDGPHLSALLEKADEPLQLLNCLILEGSAPDRMAVQIDGTCNGLQHLSALFRDETAAPLVNLSASTLNDAPADLYGAVAWEVFLRVGAIGEPWAFRVRENLKLDRKLCKSPVMVLPYGGTRPTIEEKILEAAVAQAPNSADWIACEFKDARGTHKDTDAIAGGYLAFKDRPLDKHPLFRKDMQKLGALVWDCITAKIPKAMAAMEAFREIARRVGDHNIRWSTSWAERPLWVSMAKDKVQSGKTRLKGFHLPESVRSVAMLRPSGEIAKGETVAGIGANFIHSMDAAHLANTLRRFQVYGGGGVGAIHDCLLTRPSENALMRSSVREAFATRYMRDPLSLPVEVRSPKEQAGAFYASWYELAAELGVSFPERGEWEPEEVLRSAWFFS